jgi:hypothetical protein
MRLSLNHRPASGTAPSGVTIDEKTPLTPLIHILNLVARLVSDGVINKSVYSVSDGVPLVGFELIREGRRMNASPE